MAAPALPVPAGPVRLSLTGSLLRLRSDEQLVALFRAGSEDAFGVIHERYRVRLVAYARQMLGGSTADAEDVWQDVLVRAYGALRADDRPVALRAWLYRVAHNRCIDQLRRPCPAPEDVLDVSRTPIADPDAETERRDALRRVVADIARLPGQQRSALLLREMEGLSYAELSQALGSTVPAVKSLLVRARIGLAEAAEARDAACPDVRAELATAAAEGRKPAAALRRHARECDGCGAYATALGTQRRALAALAPGAGPLATLLKVLGLGSGGSALAASAGGGAAGAGAVAGGGAVAAGTGAAGGSLVGGSVAGGAAVAGGTVAAGTAAGGSLLTAAGTGVVAKVAAVVGAAAVVGGGAVEVRHATRTAAPEPAARSAPAPARASVPALGRVPAVRRVAPQPASPAPSPATSRLDRRRAATTTAPVAAAPVAAGERPHGATAAPSEVESASGGIAAPDEDVPAAPDTARTTTPDALAAAPAGSTTTTPATAPLPADGTKGPEAQAAKDAPPGTAPPAGR